MTTKIPQEYSPNVFERIIRDLESQISTLQARLKLKRLKSLSANSAPTAGIKFGEMGYVLDGNQNFDFVVRAEDGRLYRMTGAATSSSSNSGVEGTTDHGTLTGLGDDDHLQYVLRSIVTTKGDLFVRDANAVNRLAVGMDGQLLIPDSPSTVGMKWGNLVFSNDEIMSVDDEIVTI